MVQLHIAYQSERGQRPHNEDMYGVPQPLLGRPLDERGYAIIPITDPITSGKGHLFLLADGVGGAEGGDTASRLIVEEVARRYYRDPSPDVSTSLRRVIEAGNRQLRRLGGQAGQPARLLTTLVAVVVREQTAYVAGVGDSRVYLHRASQASLLTNDHSRRQQQLDHGETSPPADRNRITRCLGHTDQVGVDTWQMPLLNGDRVLLCSDGISSYLEQSVLSRLAGRPDLQQSVNSLIDTAYDNHSADNLSAVLIEVAEPETARRENDE